MKIIIIYRKEICKFMNNIDFFIVSFVKNERNHAIIYSEYKFGNFLNAEKKEK